jgi:hypothetical protein
MKKIILIMLGLSVGLMADMVRDNTTMIVTDSATNLQWQDDENLDRNWTSAISYCDENVTLGDFTDWRLPNINELTSLRDNTKPDEKWIDPAFLFTASNYGWSSTTYASNTSFAWIVSFRNGRQYYFSKANSYFVRCVRAG